MKKIDLIVEFDDETKETGIVSINALLDNVSHDFVLDTGCKRSQLVLSEFTQNLKKVGEEESSGAFGTALYDLVSTKELNMGELVLSDFIFSRATIKEIEKNLLGMDFLRSHSIYLSLHEKKIFFDHKAPSHLQMEVIYPDDVGKQPFIDVQCGEDNLRALWDTGAGITLVDSVYIKKMPDKFKLVGKDEGTDSTGSKMTTSSLRS